MESLGTVPGPGAGRGRPIGPVAGLARTALRFDGRDDYALVRDFTGLPTSAMTAAAWVKVSLHKSYNRILSHKWVGHGCAPAPTAACRLPSLEASSPMVARRPNGERSDRCVVLVAVCIQMCMYSLFVWTPSSVIVRLSVAVLIGSGKGKALCHCTFACGITLVTLSRTPCQRYRLIRWPKRRRLNRHVYCCSNRQAGLQSCLLWIESGTGGPRGVVRFVLSPFWYIQ